LQPPAAGIPPTQDCGDFTGSLHSLRRGSPDSAIFRPLHGFNSQLGFGEFHSIAVAEEVIAGPKQTEDVIAVNKNQPVDGEVFLAAIPSE
jgi:hypothetical protein